MLFNWFSCEIILPTWKRLKTLQPTTCELFSFETSPMLPLLCNDFQLTARETPVCELNFYWACPLSQSSHSGTVNKQSFARGNCHIGLQVTLMTQLLALRISCLQFNSNINISCVTLSVWSSYSWCTISATPSHLSTQSCILLSGFSAFRVILWLFLWLHLWISVYSVSGLM